MRYLIVAILVVLAGAVTGFWFWSAQEKPAMTRVDEATADNNVSTTQTEAVKAPDDSGARQTSAAEKPGEEADDKRTDEERLLEMGYTKEEIARHRKRQKMARAAQTRFDDTVELDQLSPDEVSPRIRELFTSMMFEPAFDVAEGQEGYVSGLRIAELSDANPFARAGFEVGDRLVRINGQPLRDPAQIAHLFTALGDGFEACAERSDREYCRQIELPDS